MFRKLFVLVLAVMALPAVTPARAASVDEIVAKHFEAQGGTDKIKAIKSWRFTGKMTLGQGMEAPFTMERVRPAKTRLEFTFSGMTGIRAFDGKSGWQVMPFMGSKDPEPFTAEENADAIEDSDFDGPLMDWKAKGNTVELVGTEPVEGADAYKLKVTRKSGKVEYFYLDTETYLTVKQEATRKMRGTDVEGESYLSDYKEVNGILVPYTMSQGMKGSDHRQTMTFEKVEANVDVPEADFAMPAPAAPADSTAKKN